MNSSEFDFFFFGNKFILTVEIENLLISTGLRRVGHRRKWIMILKRCYRRGMKGTRIKYPIVQLWPNTIFSCALGS